RTVTAFFGEDEEGQQSPAAAPSQPANKPSRRFGFAARARAVVPGRSSAKPAPPRPDPALPAPARSVPTERPAPTVSEPAQPAAAAAGNGSAVRTLAAGAVVAAGAAGALGRRLLGGERSAAPGSSKPDGSPKAEPTAPPSAAPTAAAAPLPERQPVQAALPLSASTAAAPPAPGPEANGERLAELVRRPPRRNPVTGELQTAQPAPVQSPPAEASAIEEEDNDAGLAHLPPATPKGTIRAAPPVSTGVRPGQPTPLPRPAVASSAETLAERRARLDAIRAAGAPGSSLGKPAAPAQPAAPAAPRPTPAATPEGAAAIAAAAAPVSPFRKPEEPPDAPVVAALSAAPTGGHARKTWKLPDYRTLLNSGSESDFDRETLLQRARTIEETLQSFGAPGRVVEVNTGPVITQFGVEPDYLVGRNGKKSRVKVGAIAQLDKDLQLALGAKSIRIEAPVPGKGYVGIEVPNDQASLVSLRDVMDSDEFKRIRAKSPLAIALGQSVDGAPVAADLASMPHLLIAGTTGSGKSVCVNAIIGCLILNNPPDRVKFIMVDPKRVELTGYNGIPHLVAPVVVELERIVGVLKWVTREMDERYKRFSSAGARNIEDYNNHLQPDQEPMPYIVVIIDELADLMMLAPDETERVITRIAALARATGIHLVIATQRPSVDVVTGLIKANFPARIAFAVAGGVDSRVILDQPGAERLLGRGDMLYMSGNSPAPVRLQGVFLSDAEIANITRYWKMFTADADQPRPITALIGDDSLAETARDLMPRSPLSQRAFWERDRDNETDEGEDADDGLGDNGVDELYEEAVELVRRLNKASVSLLQRRLRIGYTRAARLIDMMEEEGIVGPAQEGAKPREVLPARD
ncbi:MAG: DNA translocase FtsK, partial [Aggregatilineales bacterium]